MTEELKPTGTPYGLAMAVLQSFADTLPAAIVLLPDHVLWMRDSQTLSSHNFQLLDQAAAVLSALHARHIPLTLLVPSNSINQVQACLEDARVRGQFAAVVEYKTPQRSTAAAAAAQHDPQHTLQQASALPQQPAPGDQHSSWMDAAATLKAQTGVAWQQMLMFCPAAAVDAARLANKLGIACMRVPAAGGLDVGSLRSGLELYSSKLESDRGY